MSLKDFSHAWLALMLNPETASQGGADPARLAGEARFHQLEPAERESLQGFDPARLAAWSEATRLARRQALSQALPARLARLLGPEASEALLEHLLARPQLPPLYPRRQLLEQLLRQSQDFFERQGMRLPYLRDLISYELAAAQLEFFSLPRPLPPLAGPVLAPSARLLRLGNQFPLLLESLNRGYALPDLAEGPRQRYLLVREPRSLRLEALPPLLAACLERCSGERPWPALAAEALSEHAQSDPTRDEAALTGWYEQLRQRGVLLESTPTTL